MQGPELWILYLLGSGPINSGLVPADWRPVGGGMLVRLQGSPGWWGAELGGDPSHLEPCLPTTGPVPQLPARLPRGPCPDPPHHKHLCSGHRFPRKPSGLQHGLPCPLLSPAPPGPAEPPFSPGGGIPSILGWGFLSSPPQQLTRPAQGSPVVLHHLWGNVESLCPQLACLPAPQSRDGGVHGYLTWEAAYLSLNGENRTVVCVPI